MNYSYDAEVADTIKINILEYFNNVTGVYSIKMDEIAIVSRIRWSTDNNEVIGFCFNHKDNLKMQFNNILSLTKLKEAFKRSKKLNSFCQGSFMHYHRSYTCRR